MRMEGSKTRAGGQPGDGAVRLLADNTLRTKTSGERESEDPRDERRERRAPGKLGLDVGSGSLRERNSRRGATLVHVNNVCGRERGPVRMKASKSRRMDRGSLRKRVSGS
jgi:hypothetical protein